MTSEDRPKARDELVTADHEKRGRHYVTVLDPSTLRVTLLEDWEHAVLLLCDGSRDPAAIARLVPGGPDGNPVAVKVVRQCLRAFEQAGLLAGAPAAEARPGRPAPRPRTLVSMQIAYREWHKDPVKSGLILAGIAPPFDPAEVPRAGLEPTVALPAAPSGGTPPIGVGATLILAEAQSLLAARPAAAGPGAGAAVAADVPPHRKSPWDDIPSRDSIRSGGVAAPGFVEGVVKPVKDDLAALLRAVDDDFRSFDAGAREEDVAAPRAKGPAQVAAPPPDSAGHPGLTMLPPPVLHRADRPPPVPGGAEGALAPGALAAAAGERTPARAVAAPAGAKVGLQISDEEQTARVLSFSDQTDAMDLAAGARALQVGGSLDGPEVLDLIDASNLIELPPAGSTAPPALARTPEVRPARGAPEPAPRPAVPISGAQPPLSSGSGRPAPRRRRLERAAASTGVRAPEQADTGALATGQPEGRGSSNAEERTIRLPRSALEVLEILRRQGLRPRTALPKPIELVGDEPDPRRRDRGAARDFDEAFGTLTTGDLERALAHFRRLRDQLPASARLEAFVRAIESALPLLEAEGASGGSRGRAAGGRAAALRAEDPTTTQPETLDIFEDVLEEAVAYGRCPACLSMVQANFARCFACGFALAQVK